MSESIVAPAVPRLTYLRIKNYRALRDVEFRDLTPLTMLIGPNGSGKSTVLDALAFLAEAVGGNLTQAWEKRNLFAGMRTQGEGGTIDFDIRIASKNRAIRYSLRLEEHDNYAMPRVFVKDETIWDETSGEELCHLSGKYFGDSSRENFYPFLNVYKYPHDAESKSYCNPDWLFVALARPTDTVGGTEVRQVALAIKAVLSSYRNIHLTDDHLKGYSDTRPRARLSSNGDNLPNVLYYLHDKHPATFEKIKTQLRRWVPGLADIVTEITSDERLLLRFKDAPFEKPLPAQYMSGGTMRLAALLTLLYEPNATGLLGIEEPDNELHPLLLYRLAEELGKATETRQLLVTTHSPMLLDALAPEQVWILHRDAEGYTQATRTADIPNVPELVEDGSPLGYLWTSNAFHVGNPLASFHPRPDAR